MRVPSLLSSLTVALALTGCGGDHELQPSAGSRVTRDIVLIVVDTLRADHLGCYGYDRPTSPNIDRLAADGTIFQSVVAASAFTGPSIASLLTGKYPRFHTFGYANGPKVLALQERTIAEALRSAGCRTAAFVCNPVVPARYGFAQGFDVYDHKLREREMIRKAAERTARPGTEAALEWLSSVGDGERIFLYIHYMDPHGPYTPPEEFRERFSPRSAARGPEIPGPPEKGANVGNGYVPWYQAVAETHYLNEYVGRYDAEIAHMDDQFGRILDWLQEQDRYEDAVILLTADHGEALGEGGFFFSHGHDVTPDQSFIPLILKHPERPAGGRDTTVVSHIDIYPTLTAGVGLSETEERWGNGLDLSSLADTTASDRAVYCDIGSRLAVHYRGQLMLGSVRDGKRKTAVWEDFGHAALFHDPTGSADPVGARTPGTELLDQARNYLSQPPVQLAEVVEDPEMEETLKALGYSGDG